MPNLLNRATHVVLFIARTSVIPVTGRLSVRDGQYLGVLQTNEFYVDRMSVTKLCVNMGVRGELCISRLSKEERTGPEWRHSRQKFPRRAVKQYVKLLKGKRLKSVALARDQPSFWLVYFLVDGSTSVLTGG